MPSTFREEKANKAERHLQGCAARSAGSETPARDGARCSRECARFFKQGDADARGTPEERHADEERRLAHVRATRAKDRLVFLSVQPAGSGGRAQGGDRAGEPAQGGRRDKWQPSSFEPQLTKLPEDVLVTKVLCSVLP